MTRLIVANFDAEAHLAGVSPKLPETVWQRISCAGTLLAALGKAGDRLWTPRAAPRRKEVSASAVTLVSGELPAAAHGVARILAWCETAEIAALRGSGSGSGSGSASSSDSGSWLEWLWEIVPPEPDVVARVNHRAFGHNFADRAGLALPGSTMIEDVAELERWLAAGNARLGNGAWVAKAPLSAAGRDRARGAGSMIAKDVQTRVERLIARFGEMLVEPWCERITDFGVAGVVDDHQVEVFLPHRLVVDGRGAARAIIIDEPETWLQPAEAEKLADTAQHAAQALTEAGYRGAFGIDGFRYRDPSGQTRLCPMIELNARLTFGHIAHAIYPEGGQLQIA